MAGWKGHGLILPNWSCYHHQVPWLKALELDEVLILVNIVEK